MGQTWLTVNQMNPMLVLVRVLGSRVEFWVQGSRFRVQGAGSRGVMCVRIAVPTS